VFAGNEIHQGAIFRKQQAQKYSRTYLAAANLASFSAILWRVHFLDQ
jgi:hypothetical protein